MDPKSLTRDFKEFLRLLNDHRVEYLSDLKTNKQASGLTHLQNLREVHDLMGWRWRGLRGTGCRVGHQSNERGGQDLEPHLPIRGDAQGGENISQVRRTQFDGDGQFVGCFQEPGRQDKVDFAKVRMLAEVLYNVDQHQPLEVHVHAQIMIDVELDGWFGLKGLSSSGVEAVIRHYFITLSTDGCGEESEQHLP